MPSSARSGAAHRRSAARIVIERYMAGSLVGRDGAPAGCGVVARMSGASYLSKGWSETLVDLRGSRIVVRGSLSLC